MLVGGRPSVVLAARRLSNPGTTFTYDAEGQLASCTSGCSSLAHNTAGRISSIGGWTYTYDAEGRLTVATETASGDRLEMSYDGEGHHTQLREVTAGTRDLRYQGDAIVEEKVTDAGHPSGTIVRTYTVTDAGQVVSVTMPRSSRTHAGRSSKSGHGVKNRLMRLHGSSRCRVQSLVGDLDVRCSDAPQAPGSLLGVHQATLAAAGNREG